MRNIFLPFYVDCSICLSIAPHVCGFYETPLPLQIGKKTQKYICDFTFIWIVIYFSVHWNVFVNRSAAVMIPSGHMTSIASVHPGEGSSSVTLFSLWKGFFYFGGVVPDPMWGQRSGMSMCTDCKALWGKFVICDFGLYKINWTEFVNLCVCICVSLCVHVQSLSLIRPPFIIAIKHLQLGPLTMNNRQRCSFRAPRQPRKPVTMVMPPATSSRLAAESDGKDTGREENSAWVKDSQTPMPNRPHPPSCSGNAASTCSVTLSERWTLCQWKELNYIYMYIYVYIYTYTGLSQKIRILW